jgi:hypothetical protein
MAEKENAGQDGKTPNHNHIVQSAELKGWCPIGKVEIDPQNTRADYLIILLNKTWVCLTPVRYIDFNEKFSIPKDCDKGQELLALERNNPKLGLATIYPQQVKYPDVGVGIMSLMATITDVLCDKRLAAEVDDRGFITGWSWYKGPGYEG